MILLARENIAYAPPKIVHNGSAYFMTGDNVNAVETQRKAVSLLTPGDSPTWTALEGRLAQFEAED